MLLSWNIPEFPLCGPQRLGIPLISRRRGRNTALTGIPRRLAGCGVRPAPPLYTIVSGGLGDRWHGPRPGPGLSLRWMSCEQANGLASRKHRNDGIETYNNGATCHRANSRLWHNGPAGESRLANCCSDTDQPVTNDFQALFSYEVTNG